MKHLDVLILMYPGDKEPIVISGFDESQRPQELLEKIALVIADKTAITIGTMVLNGAHIISAMRRVA